MPVNMQTLTETVQNQCTRIEIMVPVVGQISMVARIDTVVLDTKTGAVVAQKPFQDVLLSQGDLAALPAYLDAYQQLKALIYSKVNPRV